MGSLSTVVAQLQSEGVTLQNSSATPVTGASTTPSTAQVGSAIQSASQALGSSLIPSALSGAAQAVLFSMSPDRVIAVIIGLIFIAGGVFLFRPVRDTVVQVGKNAGRAALAA
jgi:hypothetical protein